jgi:hypothetical protein
MKYLVQAILIDGDRETVIHSLKSDDYNKALDILMERHKASYHYLYIAMDIETQEIICKTKKNKFALWG